MTQPAAILAISSSVTAGHVGLSAITPTLHLLGHDIIGLPTVVLSNHPGFAQCTGQRMPTEMLHDMLEALEQNGMLAGITTILTGYLPTPEHVAFAIAAVTRVRRINPSACYICDPVIGDDPQGVYIAEAAARAIRDSLVPMADILLPNRFELAWLTGQEINTIETAVIAARKLAPDRIIAKSIPDHPATLAIVDITPDAAQVFAVDRQPNVPHGTGDVFSALVAAGLPIGQAAGALQELITQSQNSDHLKIATSADHWTNATPARSRPDQLTASPNGPRVAGVDGCPAGWIAVIHPLDRPDLATWHLFETFASFVAATADCAAIAIDIPIGLPEVATLGGRQADRAARRVLGPRQSSVFAVPSRHAIACLDYPTACETAMKYSCPPRKVSKQAFHLFPKIREVDAIMSPDLQQRIVECHPEVAFWAMNDQTPLAESKKVKSSSNAPGAGQLRSTLLISVGFDPSFLEGPDCYRYIAATDDFLDACAAAWSANRLAKNEAHRLPTEPNHDPTGLRMEIVY